MNCLYWHGRDSNCVQLNQITAVHVRIRVFWDVTLCLWCEWCPMLLLCLAVVTECVLLCSGCEMVAECERQQHRA